MCVCVYTNGQYKWVEKHSIRKKTSDTVTEILTHIFSGPEGVLTVQNVRPLGYPPL